MRLYKYKLLLFHIIWQTAIFLPVVFLLRAKHLLENNSLSTESKTYFEILHKLGLPGFILCFGAYVATVWFVLMLSRKLIFGDFYYKFNPHKKEKGVGNISDLK